MDPWKLTGVGVVGDAQADPQPAPWTVCPSEGKLLKLPPIGRWALVRLWWGKLRRAVQGRMLKGYTRRRHALRLGRCLRCGACCQLGRVCPSLVFDSAGLAACLRYNRSRYQICELYPTTVSDLRDRDLIMPEAKCGYRFLGEAEEGGPRGSRP